MEDIFLKYGISGAVIIALGIYILKLEERHRKSDERHQQERKYWIENQINEQQENRKVQERQFDRMNEMSDNSTDVIRETGGILNGLKTLLENQNRRTGGR